MLLYNDDKPLFPLCLFFDHLLVFRYFALHLLDWRPNWPFLPIEVLETAMMWYVWYTNTMQLLWLFWSVYKQKVIVSCWLVSQENSTLWTWRAARECQRVDQRGPEWKRRKTLTNLYHLWATLSTRSKTKTPTFLTGTPSWRIFCKSLWVSHNTSSLCVAEPASEEKRFFPKEWVRLHLWHPRECVRGDISITAEKHVQIKRVF